MNLCFGWVRTFCPSCAFWSPFLSRCCDFYKSRPGGHQAFRLCPISQILLKKNKLILECFYLSIIQWYFSVLHCLFCTVSSCLFQQFIWFPQFSTLCSECLSSSHVVPWEEFRWGLNSEMWNSLWLLSRSRHLRIEPSKEFVDLYGCLWLSLGGKIKSKM